MSQILRSENTAWTDKAKMPDETLKNLIEHFSKHTLNLTNVPEDELGIPRERLVTMCP